MTNTRAPGALFPRRISFPTFLLAGLLLPRVLVADEPLTREQLQSLVDQRVDTALVVAVVKKNCVSFPIDGSTLAGLAASIPKPILEAAIECKGRSSPPRQPSPAPGETAPPVPPAAPSAAVPAPVATLVPATPPPAAAPTAVSSPVPAPAPAAVPAPAPPPAPASGPARLALQVLDSNPEPIGPLDFQNNECQVFVDSPASLKVHTTSGNNLGLKPDIRFLYAFKNSAQGTYDSPAVPMPAGPREIAVYCGPILKRMTVGIDAAPGKTYTVQMKLNNILAGSAKLTAVRTD